MAKIAGTNGIDIQRDYLCVAQFDTADSTVRQVAIQPLAVVGGDGYWDIVSRELKGLRRGIKFAGTNAVCSLPCDMAVVKTIEVESDESDQMAILRWELSTALVGAAKEYAFDFYEVDPGQMADRRKYLAAAIRRETLSKIRKAVGGIKLDPYIIDIDLFALTRVFQSNYRERLADVSVLVHGEHSRTKMVLVSNSSYIDYAVIDIDADACSAQEYAAALSAQTARLVTTNGDVAQNAPGVYLAGALFTDARYAHTVVGGVPRCELLDPFRKITCSAMDDEQRRTYSPQLAVAVGLALRGEDGE